MKNNLNITARITALVSFVVGTMMLAFYLYYGESALNIGFTLFFIATAFIVNIVLFVILFLSALTNKTNRYNTLETCGLMLLNIPVTVLYFYMVITFPTHNLPL
jgi:hypothetical protein